VRRDKLVTKALAMVRRAMSERDLDRRRNRLPAVRDKQWDEMTKAEKLSHNADLGLDVVKSILELGVDPRDPKILGFVKDTALTIIGQQIRVDEEERRRHPNDRGVDEERLADLDWRLSGNEGPRPPGWRGVSTGHR
jgi:hypothetical protein